jgi:hypothetical protein
LLTGPPKRLAQLAHFLFEFPNARLSNTQEYSHERDIFLVPNTWFLVLDTLTEGFTEIAKAHDTVPWLRKDGSYIATIPDAPVPANHELWQRKNAQTCRSARPAN